MLVNSIKNSMAGFLVVVMFVTAFAIPAFSNADSVYGSEKKALYNTTPTVSLPANIYKDKGFNIVVYGDAMPQTGVADKSIAYVPVSFSIDEGTSSILNQQLNGATQTTISNIKLPKIGKHYTLRILYSTKQYNAATQTWNSYGSSNYNRELQVLGKVTASFNKNKGAFKKGSKKKKVVTTLNKYGKLPSLKKRSGYKFMGWYSAKTGGYKITKKSQVLIEKNTTFYAQWKYAIKFNANKGKVSKKSKSVTSGKKYGSLPTPKRSGYTFAGWYTKKKGGSKITKTSYVSKASKHTLYAHWEKKKANKPAPANSKYVTNAEYNKITKGMSYDEVCNIIGGDGNYIMLVNGNPLYHWYTDSTEDNFVSVNFTKLISGKLIVNSKNNTCGW